MTDAVRPVLLWLRQDLRLTDQPALQAAIASGAPVIPVFILDDHAAGRWAWGGASRWFLHHALESLGHDMKQCGATLVLRKGDSLTVLRQLIAATGATEIFWTRRYEAFAIEQDRHIKEALRGDGLQVHSFNGRLLCEPWVVMNGKGEPYKVFTPYWKACAAHLAQKPPAVIDPPKTIPGYAGALDSDDLDLLPTKPDWAGGLRETWQVGEEHALTMLQDFIDQDIVSYVARRDFPSEERTSRFSPYLAFGLLSPQRIWDAVQRAMHGGRIDPRDHGVAESFLRQIVWREFAYHLLYHFPHTETQPLNPKFAAFPWVRDDGALHDWQRGMTGYPLVDAGMRQLWQTGWMHNRVRMVVASFLVKHLLLPWQEGAAWFWDTLVDADLANNTMGWQWVAGSGADAAPYFRIFNPITQSEKFDAASYIRQYVPALADLPDQFIHAPWEAPEMILKAAGVTLGKSYPRPVIEHGFARQRALEALAKTK